jgi:hypothetical protein
MIVVTTVALATLAASAIFKKVQNFRRRKSLQELWNVIGISADQKYEPSDYDQELLDKTHEILREMFPEGIINQMKDMTAEQRTEYIRDLTQKLADAYGIDVKSIEFITTEDMVARGQGAGTYGYFDRSTDGIVINLDLLATNELNYLRQTVSTLIHECRHAVQFKAAKEDGFGKIEPERARQWGVNFMRYISARVPQLYWNQSVEWDARNFAALAMEKM